MNLGAVDLKACSDGELAALTLGGRKDAFAEIMQRHQAPVYRLIRGLVGNVEEALDLTQDSFLSAYDHLGKYDGQRPLRAWLSRIAINKSRDWRRRRRVRQIFGLVDDAEEETHDVPDEAPSPEATISSRISLRRLTAAINGLSAPLREVLLLRTVEGLSQADTAAILSISAKAVETRLYRARNRLAEIIAEDEG